MNALLHRHPTKLLATSRNVGGIRMHAGSGNSKGSVWLVQRKTLPDYWRGLSAFLMARNAMSPPTVARSPNTKLTSCSNAFGTVRRSVGRLSAQSRRKAEHGWNFVVASAKANDSENLRPVRRGRTKLL